MFFFMDIISWTTHYWSMRFIERVGGGGSKAPTAAKSGTPAAKYVPHPAMSGSGSTTSIARNRDMACHTCGGGGSSLQA
jgi:hypothetical protein